MANQTPYLDVQNLTKRFGAQVLFDKISFSIAEGQKVGLVARNGTGKSTLMSVLMNKEGYENGDIIYRRDLKIGYLEQSPDFDPEETVLDACFNHNGDPEKALKAKQILTQLHITNLEQPMGQLSGGQQKRVALANVLIEEPDFLMLDEPTNHLDLEMIEWLEGYLNRGNKTIFMVTHDRFFLDKVCNVILELDDQTIYTYRGNYAYYLEKRQERMDNLRAEIQHSKNLYRRELDWMRRHPQARDIADSGCAVRRVVLFRQKAWPAPKIRSVQAPDRFGPDAVLCAADPVADGESVVWRGPESAAAGNGALYPVLVLCRFSGGADLPGATVSGDGEGRGAVCHRGFQRDLWHRAHRESVQRLRGGAAAESFTGDVCGVCRLCLREDFLQDEEPGAVHHHPQRF